MIVPASGNQSLAVGPARRVSRGILRLLHRLLPSSIYDPFYRYTFALYKTYVRIAYRTGAISAARSRDAEEQRMHSLIYRVMPHTLVGAKGLEATYRVVREIINARVPGALVELGVARGGCAALIGEVALRQDPSRTLWLFDSFEGLPDPTTEDYRDGETGAHVRPLPKGSCLGTIEQVQTLLLQEFALPKDRIQFVKGWFQDTLPVRKREIGPIALLRIDGDWYESTKCCLENLYDAVSPGGFVIVDDYDVCFGCKKAVDEFLSAKGVSVDLHFDGRGGCFFVKPVNVRSRAV